MLGYTRSTLLLLSLCTTALSQSLPSVLSSQEDLSTLVDLVGQFPGLLDSLASSGGTILAPTNEAFTNFLEAAGVESPADISEDTVRGLLTYHVLPQTLNGTTLSVEGGAIADTMLTAEPFANLGGAPNVVFASAYGNTGLGEQGPLMIYSGVGEPAEVSEGDVAFDNGVIHILSSVLNIPQNASASAETASLTTLLSALNTTELTDVVDTTANLTIFAPTDQAFQDSGIDLNALSTEELTEVLQYHVIAGPVGYSTVLEDGQEYETLSGQSVTVHVRDGALFVNDVPVEQANVITSNGVVHVVGGVLVPDSESDESGSETDSGSPSPTSGDETEPSETSGSMGLGALTRAFFLVPLAAFVGYVGA